VVQNTQSDALINPTREEVKTVKYSKPAIRMAGSAVTAIQNPNPNPKLSFQIEDAGSMDVTKTHTVSAYAADE
jgi:hypothetical protein